MRNRILYRSLTLLIVLVWLANGLLCKLLNLVPRHEQIVGRILGPEHATLYTRLIGISEVLMALWIWSGLFPRTNAILQIALIVSMNLLEFFLAPDLLLWGKANLVFALLFAALIAYREFYIRKALC